MVQTSDTEVLAPKAITLPVISASLATYAPTGYVGVSGVDLIYYDGTQWRVVSGT